MAETVSIEVDLPDELTLSLALMAHDRDITLNQLMVEILTDYLREHTS